MLRSTFYQQSLLEVDPDEVLLTRGSFERELRSVLPRLVSVDDFRELHPSTEGADTCDPLVLTGMLLLQFRFRLSDRDLIARCRRDLGFRYALALEKGVSAPGIASLKRFRAGVRKLKGPDWLFRLSLKLAVRDGLVDAGELQAVDSTNTDQRGATLDTFNLIAGGIRMVVHAVAEATGRDKRAVARDWELTRYLARSIKGAADIDWSDEGQRRRLLTSEIRDADRVLGLVGAQFAHLRPAGVATSAALLAKVARQDVEQLDDGTFSIARGTAPDRVVSATDPEARHGRKSAAKTIIGFKVHVQGTVKSQFVTGIDVTGANVHDAAPTVGLVEQTDAVGLKPTHMVADNAYGSGANRRALNGLGVVLHTKLPSVSHPGITKRDFAIDLNAMSVTCPQGETTTNFVMSKDPGGSGERVPRFTFPKATCASCPLADACAGGAKGRGRIVTLNLHEAEIQEAQRMNARPEEKALLRERSGVERLIAHLVRMGMRQARFFGLAMTRFQAFMTAAAYNLQRYMTLAAAAV